MSNPLESLYQEDLYQIPSRTTVIINKDWSLLSEADQALLVKILGSVKLSLPAIQIQSLQEFTVDGLAAFSPTRIIAFGARSGSLKSYEHVQQNGVSIVLADSLDQLDDVKKKNLWGALRQMFAI